MGSCMADDARRAPPARASGRAYDDVFGINAAIGEEVATGFVVAAAVMIVALIAVLMGMA
jgi:hypothetical protein